MLTLYKNFKYNNRYDYIKTFSTKVEQDEYFNSLSKIYYDLEGDYIRENEPFMVELSHQYLVENNINYIKFNNGYRDIYGFIIEKRYENDEVTEIIFEIDVIQTFMFDFEIKKSFVERKVCNVNEITDFDEGLDLGEHIIENEHLIFDKDSTYFAMFNGMKKQRLIFNDKGNLSNVVQMPYGTNKPLTMIDNIQYPCYFMPLQDTYAKPTIDPVQDHPNNGGGSSPDSGGVVASARKLIGLPYVWGGNYPPLGTDEGTDCSGLCEWAYNDAGLFEQVGLPHRWTTYTMIEHGTHIDSPTKAKPGDVMFSGFSSPGVPEHVVLIAEINGNEITIIEAQQPGTNILERTLIFDSNSMEIRRLL